MLALREIWADSSIIVAALTVVQRRLTFVALILVCVSLTMFVANKSLKLWIKIEIYSVLDVVIKGCTLTLSSLNSVTSFFDSGWSMEKSALEYLLRETSRR